LSVELYGERKCGPPGWLQDDGVEGGQPPSWHLGRRERFMPQASQDPAEEFTDFLVRLEYEHACQASSSTPLSLVRRASAAPGGRCAMSGIMHHA
jgi:hypothetical protein